MITLWLLLAVIGFALIAALLRLGGGIAKARSTMNSQRPRRIFAEAVEAALPSFASLRPYVVERDATGIDIDCTELQLRFEGSLDRCTTYGRLSAYDRWLPMDRVLDDGLRAPLSVADQAARIAARQDRVATLLHVAGAEH